eukprot:148059-Heterocapsa_arctica.AAC.1
MRFAGYGCADLRCYRNACRSAEKLPRRRTDEQPARLADRVAQGVGSVRASAGVRIVKQRRG